MLHLKNLLSTCYSLKYWIEKLPKEIFAQPYQAFIINMDCIRGLKKNEILLISNDYIPISKTYKKQFEESYIQSVNRKM